MPPLISAAKRLSRRDLLCLGLVAPLAGCSASGPAALPTLPPPTPPPPTRPPATVTPAAISGLNSTVRSAAERAMNGLRQTGRSHLANVIVSADISSRATDLLAWAAVRSAFSAVFPESLFEHQVIPGETLRNELLERQAANSLPSVGRVTQIDDLVSLGFVLPLDEVIPAGEHPKIDARIGPYRWDASLLTGIDQKTRLIGLPYASATQAVIYNKTVFEQAGIDPSTLGRWSWEDFIRICEQVGRPDRPALAVAGKNSAATARLVHLIMRAFGGGLVNGRYVDSLRPVPLRLGSNEAANGVRQFVQLYRRGLIQASAPTDTDTQREALFATGRAALTITTTWELTAVQTALARQGATIGTLPLPRGPAGGHTTVENAIISLMLGARSAGRLPLAFEFLSFLGSDDGSRLYALVSGALPGSDPLLKEEPWASDPLYGGFRFGLTTADRAAPRWLGPVYEQVLTTYCTTLIPDLLVGTLPPEGYLRLWEQALITALDRLAGRPVR